MFDVFVTYVNIFQENNPTNACTVILIDNKSDAMYHIVLVLGRIRMHLKILELKFELS